MGGEYPGRVQSLDIEPTGPRFTCEGCRWWDGRCKRMRHVNRDKDRRCLMYRYENKVYRKGSI